MLKFKKEYNSILKAFLDYHAPCMEKDKCEKSCPFYPFQEIFDVTCGGFCVDHPKEAAKIMGLEVIEESEDEE